MPIAYLPIALRSPDCRSLPAFHSGSAIGAFCKGRWAWRGKGAGLLLTQRGHVRWARIKIQRRPANQAGSPKAAKKT